MLRYHVGLDLAQKVDHTAVAIVTHSRDYLEAVRRYSEHSDRLERAYGMPRHYDWVDLRFMEEENEELARRIPRASYEVVQAYRLPLGTKWEETKKHAITIMTSPTLRGQAQLCVDKTGVGGPVVEDLRDSHEDLYFRAVSIAGPNVREHRLEDEPDSWVVAKKDLLARAKMLFDTGRLRIARGIPFEEALLEELVSFQYDTTPAGNQVFGAWREGQHDDLVLALCLALWDAHKGESSKVNPTLSGTLGTSADPDTLESLPEWFLQAPEGTASPRLA